MSTQKVTQSQHALQKVVDTLSNLIHYYKEWSLAHISRIISHCAVIQGIGYKVSRYINTWLLTCKECFGVVIWTDEAEW